MQERHDIRKDHHKPQHRAGRGAHRPHDARSTRNTKHDPQSATHTEGGRQGEPRPGCKHGGGGRVAGESLQDERALVLGGPGETELGTGTKGANAGGRSDAPATLAGRSRPSTSALIQQVRGTGTNGSGGCRVTVRKQEADRRTPHVLGGPGETRLGTGNKGRTPKEHPTPGIGRAKTGQGQRGRPPSPKEGSQVREAKGGSRRHAIFATPNF